MRIIPFELNIERPINKLISVGTIEAQVLHFDWPDGDTCLFGFGLNQGSLWFEMFFWWAIKFRLLPKLLELYRRDDV